MKQSHKTLLIWAILIVVFLFVYRALATPESHFVPGIGLGITTALVGGGLLLAAIERLSRPPGRAKLVAAVVFGIAPAGAIVGGQLVSPLYGVGIGAIDGLVIAWVGAIVVRNRIDRRWLAEIARLARAPDPLPPKTLRQFARTRPLVALNGVDVLVGAGRAADAERIARDVATTVPNLVVFRAILLVTARVQLRDLDGARAAIVSMRATQLALGAAELPAILTALVRTADGEAAAVAAELARPGVPEQAPFVARMRLLAHADACAASGDRARAEMIVAELAATDPNLVAHLAGSNRPIAALAHAMASSIAVGPFR